MFLDPKQALFHFLSTHIGLHLDRWSGRQLELLGTLSLISVSLFVLAGWLGLQGFRKSRQIKRETQAIADFERNFHSLRSLARRGYLDSKQLSELLESWYVALEGRIQAEGPCKPKLLETAERVNKFFAAYCVESRDG